MIQSEKGNHALETTYHSASRMPMTMCKQALVHFKGHKPQGYRIAVAHYTFQVKN